MLKNKLIALSLLLFSLEIFGQSDSACYYFVYFKDKNNSLYSTHRPWEFLSVRSIDRRQKFGLDVDESDLPVNSSYIESISIYKHIDVLNKSRWLNGVEVRTNRPEDIQQIANLPFIKEIQFLGRIKRLDIPEKETIQQKYYDRADSLMKLKEAYRQTGFSESDYKHSYIQNSVIGVPYLHNYGFRGQKLLIAVFDAGFSNAYKVPGMEDLLNDETVTLDLVDYDGSVWEDDAHGAKVISFMKTFNPGYYIGSAPFANYALFRTEIASQEYPVEEINWLFAAEYADSMGADLIAASVGYHAFDDPSLSHPYTDLNGEKTIIAKAANYAHSKGMAVISSAGNEGQNAWTKISSPGDSRRVITIGACDMNGFYAGFSSKGPTSDGRIKPDFSVPGYRVHVASTGGYYQGNGTSYSTPLFAGAFACLMGSMKYATVDSLRQLVKVSASHLNFPDSLYGYGIPDLGLAYCLATGWGESDSTEELWTKSPSILFQDLNIYFKSHKDQKIKITIKINKGSKMKTLVSKTYKVSKGIWFYSDLGFQTANGRLTKRKKKEFDQMLILIETENGSYQRQFKLK